MTETQLQIHVRRTLVRISSCVSLVTVHIGSLVLHSTSENTSNSYTTLKQRPIDVDKRIDVKTTLLQRYAGTQRCTRNKICRRRNAYRRRYDVSPLCVRWIHTRYSFRRVGLHIDMLNQPPSVTRHEKVSMLCSGLESVSTWVSCIICKTANIELPKTTTVTQIQPTRQRTTNATEISRQS